MSDPLLKPAGPYSQLVKAEPFVFIAGQLPLDPTSKLLVAADIRQQTNQVLKNIKDLLESQQYTLQQVVRTDVFLKDLEDFAAMNEEYAKYFNEGTLPVRQTIQAARLPMDALIEISCIVYTGN
jgi:2-iminobutanoate/2-iminopropanoate deaminase